MGIFSDKCEKCGEKVSKRAQFCSKCRAPAPKGWVKCGQCKKWVGVESNFCPHCNNTMHPDEVELIAGDRILRKSGMFIQRLDLDNFKTRIHNKFILEEGLKAIIMCDGAIKTVLSPGAHGLEQSGLSELFLGNQSISIFIVDSGEIVLPFRFEDVMSKDDFDLKIYLEAVFKFDETQASSIVANVLKEKRCLSIEDIQQSIGREIRQAAVEIANVINIESLVKDPETRIQTQQRLDKATAQTCNSYGLTLFRVSDIEFYGNEYNRLRKINGEAEVRCREVALQKRFLDAEKQSEMDKFKTAADLADYKELVAHESMLQTMALQHESEQLGIVQSSELEKMRLKLYNEIQKAKLEADIVREAMKVDHNEATKLKEARTGMQIASEALDLKAKLKKQRREDKAANLEIEREHTTSLLDTYSKYTPMQLITVLGADKADQVLRMRELEIREKEVSGEVKIKQLEEIHAAKEACAKEKEQLLTDFADRTERRMDKDVTAMSDIAGKSNHDTNHNHYR